MIGYLGNQKAFVFKGYLERKLFGFRDSRVSVTSHAPFLVELMSFTCGTTFRCGLNTIYME